MCGRTAVDVTGAIWALGLADLVGCLALIARNGNECAERPRVWRCIVIRYRERGRV